MTLLPAAVEPAILDDLARFYGTPLYVYELDAVRDAARALVQSLPTGIRVFYSVKANPHPSVLAAAAGEGLRREVSSVGELAAAAEADVSLDGALYTGPGKTAADLTAAIRAGVGSFSVESPTDRDRLARAAGAHTVDYLVRVNAAGGESPVGLRMTGTASQFGWTSTHWDPDRTCWSPTVRCGRSGSTSSPPPTSSARTLCSPNWPVTSTPRSRSGSVPDSRRGWWISAEASARPMPCPGTEPAIRTAGRPHHPARRNGCRGWRRAEPAVAVESGRHIVGASGTLLTTVVDVRYSGGGMYVVCDAGVNALGGMYGVGRLVSPRAQPAGQPADAPGAVLVGPLCTPLDVLSRSARVASPNVGDVLHIPNVGAYGLTASLVAFLGHRLPVEVVLDGADVVDARRLTLVRR
jgi:diaminopimelate decarboxylase